MGLKFYHVITLYIDIDIDRYGNVNLIIAVWGLYLTSTFPTT